MSLRCRVPSMHKAVSSVPILLPPECPHSVLRATSRKRNPCCPQHTSHFLRVPMCTLRLGTAKQGDRDMKPCLRIESKKNIQHTELGIF